METIRPGDGLDIFELVQARDAALRIHSSIETPDGLVCREDGAPHPCPTRQALRGEA